MGRQDNANGKALVVHEDFHPDSQIVLHQGDAEDFVRRLPDSSVTLVVTSPPYNLGKDYEEQVPIEKYFHNQKEMIGQLCRVLADNGSICWQVGNYVRDSVVYPLDYGYYELFRQHRLQLRNRFIWRYGHGLHATRRFSGRYETILWFTKTDEYVFNLDSVRVQAKYPNKRYSKGPKKGQLSGNPKGKNPSDYWGIVGKDWEEEVWNIPNVKANHIEKTEHPCQFPIELVERCVLALSNEDNWVFDPFAGVGSSLIAAIKHGRKAMGCEQEAAYVATAQERLKAFAAGTLKIRPMGRPVYKPKSTDKVAQVPDEWKESPDSIYHDNTEE